jgi:tRNA(His) guanylyltransferase
MARKREDETNTLASRLKEYEHAYESNIEYDKYIVVRLDGHKFSGYTKKYNKPFDKYLSEAMEYAMTSLVERFGAVTGYTQSDEITLVFPPRFQDKFGEITNNQVFAGRVQKMVSLMASYCSVRFNKSMVASFSDYSGEDKTKLKIGEAYFDARVYGVPSAEEAYNSVMWRVRDAVKNSKSMFAQAYCSHKSLLNKKTDEQLCFCKETTNEDWHLVEDRYKYGVLCKKELYIKSNTGISVTRSRFINWSEELTNFTPENVKMVISKYKPEVL